MRTYQLKSMACFLCFVAACFVYHRMDHGLGEKQEVKTVDTEIDKDKIQIANNIS